MPQQLSTYARTQRKFRWTMILVALFFGGLMAAVHVVLAQRLLALQGEIPANFVRFSLILCALAAFIPAAIVYVLKRRWQARYMQERGLLV